MTAWQRSKQDEQSFCGHIEIAFNMSGSALQGAWRVHARPLLSLRDWHTKTAPATCRSVWTETPEEQLSFYDSTVEQVGCVAMSTA